MAYLIRRLMLTIPTVLGLTALVFFLLHAVVPSDTVDVLVSFYGINDPELAQQLREEFGLTGSLLSQYADWLGSVLRGDLGASLFTKRSVLEELSRRLPISLELGLGAMLVTLAVAIPAGIISAVKRDGPLDYLLRGGAVLANALPDFWAATLVLVLGSVWFSWAPPLEYRTPWEDLGEHLRLMAVPVLLVAVTPAAALIRLMRSQVLEVLRQDYIRTARAKGLDARRVYGRHVLRNALLPVVTFAGLLLPRLIAGTVIVEQIFGIPGTGRYLLQAIGRLDYPVIQSTNLVIGLLLILVNVAVDISYTWIDPRIRWR